jgi:hypothetical protein
MQYLEFGAKSDAIKYLETKLEAIHHLLEEFTLKTPKKQVVTSVGLSGKERPFCFSETTLTEVLIGALYNEFEETIRIYQPTQQLEKQIGCDFVILFKEEKIPYVFLVQCKRALNVTKKVFKNDKQREAMIQATAYLNREYQNIHSVGCYLVYYGTGNSFRLYLIDPASVDADSTIMDLKEENKCIMLPSGIDNIEEVDLHDDAANFDEFEFNDDDISKGCEALATVFEKYYERS